MSEPKRIEGNGRTVRQLLGGARFAIDFYQREYAWQERQVRELIDDLSGKFSESYEPGHERKQVQFYGHYFLGSVVISHKNAKKYVVDGQQRLDDKRASRVGLIIDGGWADETTWPRPMSRRWQP